MPCGITVPQDTLPLEILAPSELNWWACQNGDLTSWAEPWVTSLLVKFPPARDHSAYHRVNTLVGPKWQHNLASEGFTLSFGKFTLTVHTATEQVFSDPTISGYYYPPCYGRKIDLATHVLPAYGGTMTKSTYVKTQDTAGNSDCWVIFDLMFSPSTATISVYGNGKFLLSAPISIANPGELILSEFSFTPTPIEDPQGEIILSQAWPNDGVTIPVYTVAPHAAEGYPSSFVSLSPTVGFLDIHRGATALPFHADPVDPQACSYIGAPLISITGSTPNQALLTWMRGLSFAVNAMTDTLDSGTCEFWWDVVNHTPILLGAVTMLNGLIDTNFSTSSAGFGWLRVVNKSFNMGNGAAYLVKNPLPLVIT